MAYRRIEGSMIASSYEVTTIFEAYAQGSSVVPLFIEGDARVVLKSLPENSVDFCMTSPPYWGKREYDAGGMGLEENYADYITSLLQVFGQVYRVLKPTGSFWLNIGDTYRNKRLLGIPWRLVLNMIDNQNWILRNTVIWNKIKGGFDNAPDRLANAYEPIFHLVKNVDYYYNSDAIRSSAREAKVVNGAVVSATGVRGVRYRRQIQLSTALTELEKRAAFDALDEVLRSIGRGEISDFRMVMRGQQRITHSDSTRVSGRAKELEEKGFYFLKYHPRGSKPSDVWDILPEDTQKRGKHAAAYPEDLCRIPILATCPIDGIVLDPFCGTGTTMAVAQMLNRKSVGIDISEQYLRYAQERCNTLL
jgi:site-specific DNA-methyltransferase (adenine-specific)